MKITTIITITLLLFSNSLFSEEQSWSDLGKFIVEKISEAEDMYKNNEGSGAKEEIVITYFNIFEDLQMEAAMRRHIGAQHTFLVERKFGKLRKAMLQPNNAAEVAELAKSLKIDIIKDAKTLDKKGVPRKVYQVNQ